MNEKDKLEIGNLCKERNAIDFKFIEPLSIVVGHWTIHKCQFGCSGYNTNLCCPPYAPTPDVTKKIIADFDHALLIHFGREEKISKSVVQIEREIFLKNYPKVIGFVAGPCTICKECTLTECQFPKLARPSMEACGIDVYSTAKTNGFAINVLKSKEETQNYYGLILIE
jgi:predicted metal-binding protein